MEFMPLRQWVKLDEIYVHVWERYGPQLTPEDLAPNFGNNGQPEWQVRVRSVLKWKRGSVEFNFSKKHGYFLDRPYVWRMIKEAVNSLEGEITYNEIKNYIAQFWNGVNPDTIVAQITALTVNHESRIHYGENASPRITNDNSRYDLLYSIARGRVVKYIPEAHGIWEIYLGEDGNRNIRQLQEGVLSRVYTPAQIIWVKNVTNSHKGQAYLNLDTDIFVLHFPTRHKHNAASPKKGELILVFQTLHGVRAFTHIVTPIDNQILEDLNRPDFRYGRQVRVLAKTSELDSIPVSSTLWKQVNFSGISYGNACRIANITGIVNPDEVLLEIWNRFGQHFVLDEARHFQLAESIMNEVKFSIPFQSVIEGGLGLVSHLARERNHSIIAAKKRQALKNNALSCEVCGFSFIERFQQEFIECHHIDPISQVGIRETSLDDLALVCSNCHRMLHTKFNGRYLSISQLKEICINGI